MNLSSEENYNNYKKILQEIADLKYASAVLQWDMETYMPAKGAETRGRQIATLSEMAHNLFTDPQLGELLDTLLQDDGLSATEKRNVELTKEDFERNTKLPSAFVRQMSEAVTKSYASWIEARRQNDFSLFEKPLNDIIVLKRQEAALLGYKDDPYDALMNDYDKGLTVKKVDALFAALRPKLLSLLEKVRSREQPDTNFLKRKFNKDGQWKAGLDILRDMHFNFEAGRQDISEHPFTTSFSTEDVRITTRIDENDFANMLWSCIHEGGHALYEQGLPHDQYGLPHGEFCSLSIHESQSRLWENCIGRGKPFWDYRLERLRETFPDQLNDVSEEIFYRGINKIMPSPIRTEADELTYHFHVMIRYEIEKKLIEGSLETSAIPAYWNSMYKEYLGIDIKDDLHGCLQDIHWSHGSFGYFATYSIGSLYAAQFYAAMQKAIPNLEQNIANGHTNEVWEWLKSNIYAFGRSYNSETLCLNATGYSLNADYFLSYLENKLQSIYNFS